MAPRKPKTRLVAPTGMTYQEIAAEMGITHQRVMQIERVALQKLAAFYPELKKLLEDIKEPMDYTIYF